MARAKASSPGAKPWIVRPCWVISGLIVAAIALYAGALHNPPVFDESLQAEFGALLFLAQPIAVCGAAYLVQRSIVGGTEDASQQFDGACSTDAGCMRGLGPDGQREMTAGFRLLAILCLALASQQVLAAVAPGDHKYSLDVGALRRNYLVHVPPQAAAGKPLPVVLNFHGGGGNAENEKWYSRMDEAADRDGYLAVYPNGTGGIGGRFLTWNAGTCCGPAAANGVDDVGFVAALLEDLARRLPYDRSRVYATGLSNGSMMAYRVAAELSERIAAVAGVAGAMTFPGFAPRLPVPVMHIHSVDDQRAFYNGGLGPAFPLTRTHVLHQSVDSMIEKWRVHDNCPSEARVDAPLHGKGADAAHTATRYQYGPCRAGSEVVLWKLTGAGHVWPGGRHDFLPLLLGPGTAVIDANREMWRFFSRFRRG